MKLRTKRLSTKAVVVIGLIAALCNAEVRARGRAAHAEESDNVASVQLPAAGTLEVAFSPNEGSQALVVKVIDSAKSELLVLAYSFTSAAVTKALLNARRRGVDVRLVADRKNNLSEDRSGKARAALAALAVAGVDVRTVSIYPIHHDKVVIADRSTVELGSFNYSDAAAHRNSENVLVNWHNPALAQAFLKHFARNYRSAVVFEAGN